MCHRRKMREIRKNRETKRAVNREKVHCPFCREVEEEK